MKKMTLLLAVAGMSVLFLFSACKKTIINNYYNDCCCDSTDTCNETSSWKGYYADLSGQITVGDSTFINNGIAKLNNSPYSYFWTAIELDIPECRNLHADSAKLEIRAKNPVNEGAIEQLDLSMLLVGENDSAWVNYVGRSFRQEYTYLTLSNNNGLNNVPELIQLFQDWTVVALETKDKVLSTYKNGVLIKSYSYNDKKLGKLKKIRIGFKGVGSVDWVKLYDNAGTLKMKEEFNTDGKSTVEWQ